MNRNKRILILKKIAQSTINIRSIPNFKPQLFSANPNIINDLNNIINIINRNLLGLTKDKINFNVVWTNPSVSGSNFHDDVKHLINLSKYIYSIINNDEKDYTLEGLKDICTNLTNMINNMLLSSNIKNDLITSIQSMLAKVPIK